MIVLIALTAAPFSPSPISFASSPLFPSGWRPHDEVEEQLRHSLDDQKKLSRLDPAATPLYSPAIRLHPGPASASARAPLDRRELAIRSSSSQRHRGMIVASGVALYIVAPQSGTASGAARAATESLSRVRGRSPWAAGGDVIAASARPSRGARASPRTIAAAFRYLEHLYRLAGGRRGGMLTRSDTPLTAATHGAWSVVTAVKRRVPELDAEVTEGRASILEELDHLRDFHPHFQTSSPRSERPDLPGDRAESGSWPISCDTFASSWPNIRSPEPCDSLPFPATGENVAAWVFRQSLQQSAHLAVCDPHARSPPHLPERPVW